MRTMLERYLPLRGWSVSTASDGLSALQILETECFDAVLADARLPGPAGIVVLEHARRMCPSSCRLVLFSGWVTQSDRERARAIGAVTITKGAVDSLELLLTVLDETPEAKRE